MAAMPFSVAETARPASLQGALLTRLDGGPAAPPLRAFGGRTARFELVLRPDRAALLGGGPECDVRVLGPAAPAGPTAAISWDAERRRWALERVVGPRLAPRVNNRLVADPSVALRDGDVVTLADELGAGPRLLFTDLRTETPIPPLTLVQVLPSVGLPVLSAHGGAKTHRVELRQRVARVGRADRSASRVDVCVDGPVGGVVAELAWQGDRFTVTDVAAGQGLYLSGGRVPAGEPLPVWNGARLALGLVEVEARHALDGPPTTPAIADAAALSR